MSYPAGNGQIYSPHNYDHKFEGAITLRRALEDSRNVPAIKMMDVLGAKNVLAYAKKFGFEEEFPPYLPIALGAGDATLLEVTSAYTVFPNQGVRMKPYFVGKVQDRDGNLLEENRSEPVDVIRADTAYVMTNLLRGVVVRGTAAAAGTLASEWPIAGKTGTVDDNTDAWFVGFDPDITVGVWIGFDEKKSLGGAEQGSYRRAADVDGVHEGVHRRSPRGKSRAPQLRGARKYRIPDRGKRHRQRDADGCAGRDPRSFHLGYPARREHQPAAITEYLFITPLLLCRRGARWLIDQPGPGTSCESVRGDPRAATARRCARDCVRSADSARARPARCVF